MGKNKDVNKSLALDLKRSGRLHDGYAFLIALKSGTTVFMADENSLGNLIAKWGTSGRLEFSGAREEPEGSLIGAGIVDANEVALIRDWRLEDEHGPAALAAARALLEVQGEAAQELLEETDEDEGDEEEIDGDEIPEGSLTMFPTVPTQAEAPVVQTDLAESESFKT